MTTVVRPVTASDGPRYWTLEHPRGAGAFDPNLQRRGDGAERRPRWGDHVAAAVPLGTGTVQNKRVIDHFSDPAP
jgi:hypothetical protein